ncbi:MAG TPA: methyltransferase domain-containing protein [Stellaceae bacterium]|nr:methyltransferase domain-containing protein [Stellaceae bacterium]
MTFDPDAVRAFEHAGWEKAAREYRATFAAASGEFVENLLDAAEIAPGIRLLDLCCGPGIVTGAADRRGAEASGLDFSPAMLAEASAAYPSLCFHQGDAEAIPLADASFDAVVSNFGIHHVPRPERALAEAFRVLRPAGHLAFTNWANPADNIAWQLLFDAVRLHGVPGAAKAPPSGGGLDSVEVVLRLLREAGFADTRAELVRREWRIAHPGDLIAVFRRGTVRTAALIEAQRPAALLAIETEIARRAAAYRSDGWYVIPIAAILGRGVKPR